MQIWMWQCSNNTLFMNTEISLLHVSSLSLFLLVTVVKSLLAHCGLPDLASVL
jgi:hypothetical protein